MSTPWEIMKKFQDQLKSSAVLQSDKNKTSTSNKLNGALQPFLPTSNHNLRSRINQVKALVNESCNVVNESRLPTFNSTVINSCQNCTCVNGMNQSVIGGPDLNTTITAIKQSYDSFLENQRQQFMFMINQFQHAVSEINMTVNAAEIQQSTLNALSSSSTCDQSRFPECNSLGKTKAVEISSQASKKQTSKGKCQYLDYQVSISEAPDLENPTCITNMERDGCSSSNKNITLMEKVAEMSEPSKSSQAVGNGGSDLCDSVSSFGSFEDHADDNFKPMRRSLHKKMRNCSVVLCSPQVDSLLKQADASHLSEKKPSVSLEAHEKDRILSDLTIIFNDKASTKFHVESDMKRNPQIKQPSKESVECNKPVTTRSGRNVQTPGAFWLSKPSLETKSTVEKSSRPIKEQARRGRPPNGRLSKDSGQSSSSSSPLTKKQIDNGDSAAKQNKGTVVAKQRKKSSKQSRTDPHPRTEKLSAKQQKEKSTDSSACMEIVPYVPIHNQKNIRQAPESSTTSKGRRKMSARCKSAKDCDEYSNENQQLNLVEVKSVPKPIESESKTEKLTTGRKRVRAPKKASTSKEVSHSKKKKTLSKENFTNKIKESHNDQPHSAHASKRRKVTQSDVKSTQNPSKQNRTQKILASANTKKVKVRACGTPEPNFVCYFQDERTDSWSEA